MSWSEELDRWTADYLPDMTYEHDVPLARYASFRIGGPARRVAFPRDGSQMVLLMEEARACGAAPLVIGNGTNLLFPDEGLERLVVNTRDMSGVSLDAAGRVTAEAGASLARAAVFAQQHGLFYAEYPKSLIDLFNRNPETRDFVLMLRIPASSRTARAGPPAMIPVPSGAGISSTLALPYSPVTPW